MSFTLLTPLGALLALASCCLSPRSCSYAAVAARYAERSGCRSRARSPAASRSQLLLAARAAPGSPLRSRALEWTSARKVRIGCGGLRRDRHVPLDARPLDPELADPVRARQPRCAALPQTRSRTCRSGSPPSPIACCRTSSRASTTTSSSRRCGVRSGSTGRRRRARSSRPRRGSRRSRASSAAASSRRPRARGCCFVITDGESVPISGAKIGAAFRRPPGVDTIFLHVWDAGERVYNGADPEPQYSPDPRSRGNSRRGRDDARRQRLRRERARRRDREGAHCARRRHHGQPGRAPQPGWRSRRTSPARSSFRSPSCCGGATASSCSVDARRGTRARPPPGSRFVEIGERAARKPDDDFRACALEHAPDRRVSLLRPAPQARLCTAQPAERESRLVDRVAVLLVPVDAVCLRERCRCAVGEPARVLGRDEVVRRLPRGELAPAWNLHFTTS